jgi:hypothetical protein
VSTLPRRTVVGLLLLLAAPAVAAPPTAVDKRLVVELVAAEPDIVMPAGLEAEVYGAESTTDESDEGPNA